MSSGYGLRGGQSRCFGGMSVIFLLSSEVPLLAFEKPAKY